MGYPGALSDSTTEIISDDADSSYEGEATTSVHHCSKFNSKKSSRSTKKLRVDTDLASQATAQGSRQALEKMSQPRKKEVSGESWFFEPDVEVSGRFKMTVRNFRVPAKDVSTFLLAHNSNLDGLASRKATKGSAVMAKIKDEWRFHLVYALSSEETVLLEWLGNKYDSLPAFLFMKREEFNAKLSSHFKKVVYSEPPPLYFVNFHFTPNRVVPHDLRIQGPFPTPNVIDGCLDQAVDGPCRFYISEGASRKHRKRARSNQRRKRGKRNRSNLLLWQR